ncbi:MAG: lysophospholipid acyltransferase family protein [Kiritimatiellae bacterium]|nr:lysophospholipid acyltransferase family protein [Kiritimatiellia bacterium]
MTFLQKHAYDTGRALAALVWPFFRKRRRLSIDNLLKCGVAQSEKEARTIAKNAWCHLAGHIAEALCVPGVVNATNWRDHIETEEADPEAAKLLLDTPGEPILLVSAHHGVWEAATNTISFTRPMIAIARTMNNPLVEKWMKKHHFRGPVTIIGKKNGMTQAILRQWERDGAAMTILMDQHYSKGAKLRFLGRPARTFTSAARLAVRTGRRIVVGSFVRTGPYRYRLVGGPPLSFAKDANVEEVAQILNDRLGEAIRRYPDQYLWMHRRWRDD